MVFANGLNPGEGPGLVFQTLPLALGQMPGGAFFSTIFFVLLSFAAWTSAIGLMEPAVAWIVEKYSKTRAQATVAVGLLIWFIGFGSVLSFNVLAETRFLAGTIFDNVDYLTSNVMLPLGGLLIVCISGSIVCNTSSCNGVLAL